MSRTAIDTDVVVAALLAWHEAHDRARRAAQTASRPGSVLILPVPALVQAFSVMTRLPRSHRVPPVDALTLLRESFAARATLVTTEAAGGWALLEEAVRAGGWGGGVYDFQILECAASAGAKRLLTLNPEDFVRFGDRGVEIAVP